MDSIKESLEAVTNNVLYSSESDKPISVLSWGNIDDAAILQQIATDYGVDANPVKVSTDEFFNHYIHRQQMTGDDTMIANAEQFKKLYAYLQSTGAAVEVYRCGTIKVGIYIIIKIKDNGVWALHTIAIET